MMSTHSLDLVLGTASGLKVARLLALSPEGEFTGREVARLTGISHGQASVALRRLEEARVASRRAHGRADAWTLSRDFALSAILIQLFAHEREIPKVLFKELRQKLRSLHVEQAVVFGSVARGDTTSQSDLDLFIQVESPRDVSKVQEALLDLRLHALHRYGVDISPLIYSRSQLRHPPNPALLDTVRKEGIPLLPGA